MTETSIHKKLLDFQKLGISIKKGKKNPHFKNDYADINEILDKVKPALNSLGVVIIQTPDEIGLITILHDTESGTEISGRINFIGATDPQKLGSNITYYRRYSLIAMLGLEDDDDDGNKASTQDKVSITIEQAINMLRQANTEDTLRSVWASFSPELKNDPEVVAVKDEMKVSISNIK